MSVIKNAHDDGARAALVRFGLEKIAAGFLEGAKRMAIGEPGRAFVEGPGAFRPGGLLHWRNVLWPSQYGPVGNTLGRLGTLAMIPMALGAANRPDPREGRLSNTLGTLGGLAGSMYGSMAGGFLGLPLGGALGTGLGHGLGHLLGSHPQDQQP